MNFQQFSKAVSNYTWKFLTVEFESGFKVNDRLFTLVGEYVKYEFHHDISESLHWISSCEFAQHHQSNLYYLKMRDEKLSMCEENESNSMGYCETFVYISENGYTLTYQTTSGTIIQLVFDEDGFKWLVHLPSYRKEGNHHFYLKCLSKGVSEASLQTKYDLWQLEEGNSLDEDKYNAFSKEWNEKVDNEYPPTLKGYKIKKRFESLAEKAADFSDWCWKTPENRGKKQKAKKLIKEMEYLLSMLKEEYPKEEEVIDWKEYEEGLEEEDVEYEDFPEDDVE